MTKIVLVVLTMALVPVCGFAVDGQVLINQATVMAAGGFPYHITQPGSYKLSGNLTVPDANTTAISITADNVTIDLNGFSIIGPVVCVGAPVTSCSPLPVNGVSGGTGVDGGTHNGITVVNGGVRGMGGSGIVLSGNSGFVEKVHVDSNVNDGIVLSSGTVSNNMITGNGFQGIEIFTSGTVIGNTVTNNIIGITVFCPSSVVGNTVFNNRSSNLVTANVGCAVANNAAP